MHFSTAAALAAFAATAAAAPTSFSLPNGFPKPNATSLASIQKSAGGTLPNGGLPKSLKADAIIDLKVIAINEIFEVAYFNSLLHNVSSAAHGYTDFGGAMSKEYVVNALHQIRAQEELHAIGANAILASAGATTINPCQYKFPVTNFLDAVELASTFTDLVLGTLQGVQQNFALDGGEAASALVPLLGSIIGQEGEQDGAFRLINKKVPSASPFLTAGSGVFAFNAVAQNFIVPGSCGPEVAAIGIPTLETLTSVTKPTNKNMTLTFTTSETTVDASTMHIAYISGQNLPVVVPISKVGKSGAMTTFQAEFPFNAGFSKGLTVAGLTKTAGPFADGTAVAASSIAGPALLEVD